ncbi:hypothetical protein ACQPW1_02550 [Nocardia sp. CA-128927]|uniref:hypothetical protein n=1 Tax=Nocardia sp. CA-128927 TaxID=3239975 RepID=UPI003D9535C1
MFVPRPANRNAIRDVLCTADNFDTKKQQEFEDLYRTLPVVFGTFENEADPLTAARTEVLGGPDITNEIRHKLCNDKALMRKYYTAVTRLVDKAGVTFYPDYSDPEGGSKELESLWTKKLTGYETAGAPWLKGAKFE